MKHLSFIIILLIALVSLTCCENSKVTKLKKEIAITNANCPINMGIGGELLSIKYQEKNNRVILYYSINENLGAGMFLNKNKDKMKQQFRLTLSKKESKKMLKDIVNAKASLMVIYKRPKSGKTIKFELSYDELKNIGPSPLSNYEIQRLTIENKIDIENSGCPIKSEEGLTTTKVAIVDDYIVYYCEMDEDLYDMKEFKLHWADAKKNQRDFFKSMRKDVIMQNELKTLINLNMGYRYRYYGNRSKEYVDIIFPAYELSDFIDR